MSKNILLNLILFFISLTCKAQWTPIGPYGGQIDDMIAINDTLFAASPNGVFKSLNNGNNWVRESEGLSATFNVSKFLYHDSILYIGTDKGLYLYQPNERKWSQNQLIPFDVKDFTAIGKAPNIHFFTTDGNQIYTSIINKTPWSIIKAPTSIDTILAVGSLGTILYIGDNNAIYINKKINSENIWLKDTSFPRPGNITSVTFKTINDTLYYFNNVEYAFKLQDEWKHFGIYRGTSKSTNYSVISASVLLEDGDGRVSVTSTFNNPWSYFKDVLYNYSSFSRYLENKKYFFGYNNFGIFRFNYAQRDSFELISQGINNAKIQYLDIWNSKIFAGSNNQASYSMDNGYSWKLINKIYSNVGEFCKFKDTIYNSAGFYIYNNFDSLREINMNDALSLTSRNDTLYKAGYTGIFKTNRPTNNSWTKCFSLQKNAKYFKYIISNPEGFLFSIDDNNNIFRCDPGQNDWKICSIKLNETIIITQVNKLFYNNKFLIAACSSGIYISEDFGNSWKHILKNLSIDFIIGSKNQIIAADTIGNIYRSINFGNAWESIKFNLPNNILILDIALDHEYIYLATNGASAWRFPLGNFYPSTFTLLNNNLSNANSKSLSISTSANYPTTVELKYGIDSTLKSFTITRHFPDTLLGNNQNVLINLTTLSEKTTYYYQWKAINSAGITTYNPIQFFKTQPYLKIDPLKSAPLFIKQANVDTVTNTITKVTSPIAGIVLNQKLKDTKVKFIYRNFVENIWKDSLLLSITDTFKVKLPPAAFDAVGMEYYFSISPPSGFSSGLKEDTISTTTRVAINFPAGLPLPYKLQTGSTARDYNLFSFPLSITDNRPGQMLYKILDTDKPDDTKYRFMTYVGPTGNANYKNIWNINPIGLEPGTAYWFAARRLKGELKTNTGTTVAANPAFDGNNFEITINPGYNQIGNPYRLKIAWSNVQAISGSQVGALIGWVRQGDTLSWKIISHLEPFGGGYVYNSSLTKSILKIPVRNISNSLRKEQKQEPFSMLTNFSLEQNLLRMQLGALGVHPQALPGSDMYDMFAPAIPSDFPTIQFDSTFVKSIHPPNATGQQWDVNVGGLISNTNSTLKWDIENTEGDKQLWLHDLSRETLTDMHSINQYKFYNSDAFRIYYGSEEYIKKNAYPEKIVLHVFPNPVLEKTTISFSLPNQNLGEKNIVKISLLDITGKLLEVIEENEIDGGFYTYNLHSKESFRGIRIIKLLVKQGQPGERSCYSKVVFE